MELSPPSIRSILRGECGRCSLVCGLRHQSRNSRRPRPDRRAPGDKVPLQHPPYPRVGTERAIIPENKILAILKLYGARVPGQEISGQIILGKHERLSGDRSDHDLPVLYLNLLAGKPNDTLNKELL